MRPRPQRSRSQRLRAALLLASGSALALVPAPAPASAAAATQEQERQIRREIVVVGPLPAHRRVIHERLAERGYLGVSLLGLTPELRQHFGAPRQSGVLVARVDADSPAAAAGVAVGDVVTAIDGEPLRSAGQLAGRVGGHRRGDEVELEIVRQHRSLKLRATLAQSERRQVEIGQFVWHDEGPVVIDLDPEAISAGLAVDPEVIERVIAIDPETINDSISELLERLEAKGGAGGALRLDLEQRRQLEKRIGELEKRLLEMERKLHQRHGRD